MYTFVIIHMAPNIRVRKCEMCIFEICLKCTRELSSQKIHWLINKSNNVNTSIYMKCNPVSLMESPSHTPLSTPKRKNDLVFFCFFFAVVCATNDILGLSSKFILKCMTCQMGPFFTTQTYT